MFDEGSRVGSKCCTYHGDESSHEPSFFQKFLNPALQNVEKQKCVQLLTHEYKAIPIPRVRLARTEGLEKLFNKTTDSPMWFPIKKVCGLHQERRCFYGAKCKHIHICRMLFQSILQGEEWKIKDDDFSLLEPASTKPVPIPHHQSSQPTYSPSWSSTHSTQELSEFSRNSKFSSDGIDIPILPSNCIQIKQDERISALAQFHTQFQPSRSTFNADLDLGALMDSLEQEDLWDSTPTSSGFGADLSPIESPRSSYDDSVGGSSSFGSSISRPSSNRKEEYGMIVRFEHLPAPRNTKVITFDNRNATMNDIRCKLSLDKPFNFVIKDEIIQKNQEHLILANHVTKFGIVHVRFI